jgi:hypothetical protein
LIRRSCGLALWGLKDGSGDSGYVEKAGPQLLFGQTLDKGVVTVKCIQDIQYLFLQGVVNFTVDESLPLFLKAYNFSGTEKGLEFPGKALPIYTAAHRQFRF